VITKVWKRTRDKIARIHADVLMTSFPKCGRTWLRLMLGSALQRHFRVESRRLVLLEPLAAALHPSIPDVLVEHDSHPFRKRSDQLDASKAHLADKRVILLVRDPRDVMVSAYFHKRKRRKRPYPGSISEYLREETGSLKTFIQYYNHWAAQRHVPRNFLLVRYEDLHAGSREQLRRVLDLVGVGDVSDGVIEDAVRFASFENMRAMETSDALGSSRLRPGRTDDETSYKTRQGAVGRYHQHLSSEDIRYIDERVAALSPIYGYTPRPA
jgi:hypothetical protein